MKTTKTETHIEVTLPDGTITKIDFGDEWILGVFPNWTRTKNHVTVTRKIKTPYGNAREVYYLHRVITNSTAQTKAFQVDHINRDSFDNRRSNLRFATPSQNSANSMRNKRAKSGFRGVSQMIRISKLRKPWRAYCRADDKPGKQKCLGYFATPEEAARAYDKAARERWGAFAVLNFPEDYT